MANVELPGSKRFYTQMELQTATQNTDESLAQELQNTFQTNHTNMVLYIMEKNIYEVYKSGQTESIMCNIINMSSIST